MRCFHRVGVVVGIALAACHGAPTARSSELTPACITPPDEDAAITQATVDGPTRVRYCVGDTPQCFSLDVASGKLARLPVPPAAPVSEGARVEVRTPELKICKAGDCTTLPPELLPETTQLAAATNAAGTHLVVLLGNAAAGQGYAEIWDVEKVKKTAVIRYARGDFKCGEVTLLDDTIYVSARACTSPAARAALYTLKGQKIANVGNQDFGVFGNKHVQVDAARWGFLEENANRITIQDIVTGTVAKTIDISPLWGDSPEAMGNPGESALVRLGAGTLAVIAGSPANGSVAVVDVATGEVKVTRAPLCR